MLVTPCHATQLQGLFQSYYPKAHTTITEQSKIIE